MAETGAETGAAAAVRDSLGGDIADLGAEATGRILAEFLRDLPAATAAILSGPAEDRARAAHRLNGAAANFRLDEFCAVLARIERAGAAADAGLLAEAEARAAEAETLLDAAAAGLGLGAPAAS
jgi:two-component system sensor histidine kinase TorS